MDAEASAGEGVPAAAAPAEAAAAAAAALEAAARAAAAAGAAAADAPSGRVLLHVGALNGGTLCWSAEPGARHEVVMDGVVDRGSYGKVWRGRWGHRAVAVKMMRNVMEYAQSALREVSLLRMFQHTARSEHVLSCHHIVLHEQHISLVMDLMEQALETVLRPRRSFAPAEVDEAYRWRSSPEIAERMARQMVLGVEHLHRLGVLHRDIKPQNVLVRRDPGGLPDCLLADFGLSRFEGDEDRGEGLTQHVVTRWYRPPELCDVHHMFYGKEVDMWSLGCIFGELCESLLLGGGVSHPLFAGSGSCTSRSSGSRDRQHYTRDQLPVIMRRLAPPAEATPARWRGLLPADRATPYLALRWVVLGRLGRCARKLLLPCPADRWTSSEARIWMTDDPGDRPREGGAGVADMAVYRSLCSLPEKKCQGILRTCQRGRLPVRLESRLSTLRWEVSATDEHQQPTRAHLALPPSAAPGDLSAGMAIAARPLRLDLPVAGASSDSDSDSGESDRGCGVHRSTSFVCPVDQQATV